MSLPLLPDGSGRMRDNGLESHQVQVGYEEKFLRRSADVLRQAEAKQSAGSVAGGGLSGSPVRFCWQWVGAATADSPALGFSQGALHRTGSVLSLQIKIDFRLC